MAKASFWKTPDAEVRKLGERKGLDTPVVLAVNVACLVWGSSILPRAGANALSMPPEEYGRKAKTQRN